MKICLGKYYHDSEYYTAGYSSPWDTNRYIIIIIIIIITINLQTKYHDRV